MKRVFLAILALSLGCLGAKAQWSLNPEAGLSLNVADVSGVPCLPSWKVGVGVDYDFTPRWGISSGLYFTERRINESYSGYGYIYGDGHYGSYSDGLATVVSSGLSFYFPLMGKVSKTLSEDVRLSFAAGPYVGYCFNQGIRNHMGNWEEGVFTEQETHYFDGGVMARLGIEAKRWTMALSYEADLVKRKNGWGLRSSKVDPIHSLSLTVGYKFYLGKN